MLKKPGSRPVWVITMALCFAVLQGQEETGEQPTKEADPALGNFLLSSGIIPDENDIILKVDLFTIVPSLRRMVVRTGEESEKTLVLGLSDEAFAKDGEKFLAFTDLKRGDPLILVVGEDHVTVREIYKYHPVPGGVGNETPQPAAEPPAAPAPPAETAAPEG